jgi:hypothetical protein
VRKEARSRKARMVIAVTKALPYAFFLISEIERTDKQQMFFQEDIGGRPIKMSMENPFYIYMRRRDL